MDPREYYVYVIALAPEVLQDTRFRSRNSGVRDPLECLYVGSTALPPEKRFEQHLNGYKSNRYVERWGLELRPRLYEGYNPIGSREEAEEMERYVAERLRSRGYAVWTG